MDKNEKIQMLLDYAKECYKQGHKPTKKEIRQRFNLELYNYFENIEDYHKKADIAISLRNHTKEEARDKIVDYLHKKVKEKQYPIRKEIEKELKIHFSTYFKNLKELYDIAKIDYSLVEQNIKNKISTPHTYSTFMLDQQKKLIQELIK